MNFCGRYCLNGDSSKVGNDIFVDGPFGSELKVADYTSKEVMLIQLQNIGDGHFNLDNRKYTSESKYKQLLPHSMFPGDIVIAKMSDPVARAAIVPAINEKYLVVADSVKLRVDESKFNTKFI